MTHPIKNNIIQHIIKGGCFNMDKSINKLIYLLKRTYNELTYSIKNNYFNGSEEERQKELLTCHFTGNLGLWLIQNKQFSPLISK